MASFIRTADHLTIVFDDGQNATVYPSNPQYKNIVAALNEKDYERVRTLSSPAATIKKTLREFDDTVEIIDGEVFYNGQLFHNTLTQRMVDMLNEGFDIEPMKKHLIKLKQNPSKRAVEELYRFMEKGNLPITEDGDFLAYKKVDQNYKDCHTHTIDNSVGQIVTMERDLVDEDKARECSSGLHFCSRNYLSSFGGSHIMIVKINPADVVAIPEDYNSAKGRCCRYEVIGELTEDEKLEGSYRAVQPVAKCYDEDDMDDSEDQDDIDDWYYGAPLTEDMPPDILEDNDEFVDVNAFDTIDEADLVEAYSTPLSPAQRRQLADNVIGDYTDNMFGELVAKIGIPETNSAFVGLHEEGEPVPADVAQEIEDDVNAVDGESMIVAYNIDFGFGEFDGSEVGRWVTAKEASEATGANESSIRKVLNGQRNTAGGYKWKRV